MVLGLMLWVARLQTASPAAGRRSAINSSSWLGLQRAFPP